LGVRRLIQRFRYPPKPSVVGRGNCKKGGKAPRSMENGERDPFEWRGDARTRHCHAKKFIQRKPSRGIHWGFRGGEKRRFYLEKDSPGKVWRKIRIERRFGSETRGSKICKGSVEKL